ncbi:signal recognition particle-docking protein FtsY [Methanogenium marinum]|uniref:Signal recognition particle receptor FtsY n=1 Tax=Methanogenium marinum TaxID=348610 RepID=A0A9Q4KWG5_9EURY|nr:signal recognition particle-docking protein FtsY [Methanogenium marinum]MDE4909036.1 signal recognition particle-docking protein FtsY [Methanogenium marinum]
MFDSLKSKLRGVRGRFSREIEDSFIEEVAGDKENISQTPEITSKAIFETPSEEISAKIQPSGTTESPDKKGPEEPSEPKKGKVAFSAKIRSLVKDHEVHISEKKIEGPLQDLEIVLLENDVALQTVDAISGRMRNDLTGSTKKIGTSIDTMVMDALRDALLDVLGEGFSLITYIDSHDHPVKILFTGVNGAGKTTTIAKVAAYLKQEGYSVVIGSGDTFRAGANQQMQTHADRVGVKVIRHQEGADPSAVLYDAVEYAKAHDIDVVLADTAGRFHNRANLMNQLAKIRRVFNPDIVAYVDEAVAGNDAVIRAEEFNNAVGTDVVVLTKADMDTRGGAAISIAHTIGRPIMFLGTGQGYTDIVPFEPKAVVSDLLGDE